MFAPDRLTASNPSSTSADTMVGSPDLSSAVIASSLVATSLDHPFEEAYEILLLSRLHGALPRGPHGSYRLIRTVASELDQDASDDRAGTTKPAAAVDNNVLTLL